MTFIPTILDQHVEEAALNWLRRDDAVGQPHYTLEDLATLDNRLNAHLDGLRIADADDDHPAWKICEHELKWGEPGEIFPAAVLAVENKQPQWLQRVIDVAASTYENSRALASALAWLTDDLSLGTIDQLLSSDNAFQQRIAIAACIGKDRDPGSQLEATLKHADALLAARGIRAAGELGRTDLLPGISERLADPDPHCQSSAAWSLARLSGDSQAVDILKSNVEQASSDAERALQMAARIMSTESAASWSRDLVGQTETARFGVRGLGAAGLPLIPELLEIMNQPALARIAGESFSLITGVDLAYDDLDGESPEGFHAGPTENPEDEDVRMDPDENLPWPHVERLKYWWQQNQADFEPDQRYLCGNPITDQWLQHVLIHGFQRQRAAAALELALRNPQQPLFNVRAPGTHQQKVLGVPLTTTG